jgi:hypothetical protein
MNGIESAVKQAVITLAVIWLFNQLPVTRELTQRALSGY